MFLIPLRQNICLVMSKYLTIVHAKNEGNGIELIDTTPQEIADLIATGQVVIVKGAMTPDRLVALRNELFDWSLRTPVVTKDDFRTNRHRHRAQTASALKTPQVMHDFVFSDMYNMEEPLRGMLLEHFEPLRDFYAKLTGNDVPFGVHDGPYFHPGIMHYPEGGGFFGNHIHNLEPQKVGVVVSMSQLGVDFESGATMVVVNGEVVNSEGYQDLGDMLLFRYDLEHWVSQSNLRHRFSWESPKGRWTMLLPFYDPINGHVIHWEDFDNKAKEQATAAV